MKHTSIKVSSLHNPRLEISLPAVRPPVGCTHGMFAVIFPQANHDMESTQRCAPGETEALDLFHQNLARFLYTQMSGHDLKVFQQAMAALPTR